MNDSPDRLRGLLIVAVALVAVGAVAVLILSDRSRCSAVLGQLHLEAAELRVQLEARDGTISSLEAGVQQLRSSALVADRQLRSPTLPAELELARRVADLAVQQSNTAVVVERLLAPITGPPPEEAARRRQATITSLEVAAQEHQQRVEAAKQKSAELLLSLSIPAEVSTMDAATVMRTASLRAYWPYFEAEREGESLQYMAERLQVRLLQERVDAGIEPAR